MVDYDGFRGMRTDADLERENKEKERRSGEDKLKLKDYWLGLLEERPYNVDELMENIPQHLSWVRRRLPWDSLEAVGEIFFKCQEVTKRYNGEYKRRYEKGSEKKVFYGLSRKVN